MRKQFSFNLHLYNSMAEKILKMATQMFLATSLCMVLIARFSEARIFSSQFNCDFTRRWFNNKGWCKWRTVHGNGDDFMWTRDGSRNYLYTDATYPAKERDKARIATKEKLKPTTGICLSFSYRMESKSNKQSSYALRVFIKKEGEADQMIWSRVGDQGKEKLSSNVTLISKLPFEVIFESERGAGGDENRIDTQLDDIKFQDGKCEKSWFEQKCSIDVKAIGCFKDRIADRVMGELLATQRETNNGGPLIDWKNYQVSLERLLCQCASLTKAKGYKYFGLQFYGECWSAPGDVDYDKYGATTGHCVDGGFTNLSACNGPQDGACVGQAFTNYVYQLS